MEELIGKIWHRHITQAASLQYPDDKVILDDIRPIITTFFRALGGEGSLHIETTLETINTRQRSLLQRIAGTNKKNMLASRYKEVLWLPEEIALFPDKQLNQGLYFWLAAVSSFESTPSNGFNSNQHRISKTLTLWSGLAKLYQTLVTAHLPQRPKPDSLPKPEAEQERAIRRILLFPHESVNYSKNETSLATPFHVPLWLYPSPHALAQHNSRSLQNAPNSPKSSQQQIQTLQKKRKRANRTEMPNANDGLMTFRLESLWSWTEYIKVDRTGTEDNDDNVMQTADDMDNITLARDGKSTASTIKLDLDLPSAQYDDIVLEDGILINEWDYKQQRLQKDHCRLQVMMAKSTETVDLSADLQFQARKIRRQFEALCPQHNWVSRQQEGIELDLDNYIGHLVDRKRGYANNDIPVYRGLRSQNRDLSCLLLADLSLSTDAHINVDTKIIDVIRESLYLFSEALNVTGDRFSLYGFSSRNRSHIRFHTIKTFNERYNDTIKGRIHAIKPGYYTRMGAAIRHANKLLRNNTSRQKLLLILTDGKPNDLDKYEGRYGLEDTRMAILEAKKEGLHPFCVTIDEHAEDYLPYLFGKSSYVLIRDTTELPRRLPLLYLKLTK